MKASEIAAYIGQPLIGSDFEVDGVCSLDRPQENKLAFYSGDVRVGIPKHFLLLVKPGVEVSGHQHFICVENPPLTHVQVTARFFIDPFSMIPTGDGQLQQHIFHGVYIYDCVEWGEKCFFKPGTVIGHSGFGFERDTDGVPFLKPHLGRVIIGDNVQFGANNTIPRGTFGDTVISNNVKTDDHVHIAHNCVVGKNTMFGPGVVVSGSVIIGKNCWLGTNCSIIQKITIGDNVTIGMGAIVVKDVPDNTTLAGFKAEPIEVMRKVSRMVKKL